MTTKITAANLVVNAITTSRLSDTIAVAQVDPALFSPTITSISYGTQTAATPNTANTITITGTGFDSSTQVLINDQLCSSVTYISTTQLQAVTPLLSAAGAYDLLVNNSYSQFCLKKNYVYFDNGPTWTTAAGILGSVNETVEISTVIPAVVATSNGTVRYSYKDGFFPPGTAINPTTGQLTGIINQVVSGSTTTYYFTIDAIDAENQATARTFGVTVIPEIVTWSIPATGATITSSEGSVVSQSLSATSSFGNTVTYSGINLPAGLGISGSVVSGTLTLAGSTAATLIASTSTGRSGFRTLNFNISPSPEYLVVAGGGGGGNGDFYYTGGGGGAGGMRTGLLPIVSGTQYTVTVGGGGGQVTQGSNSVLASIISTGGGNGATSYGGGAGGSGGGAGLFYQGQFTGLGGAGTAGPPRQGYDGGASGTLGEGRTAGAGGGAGAVGQSGTTRTSPANGGIGAQSSITGVPTYYAGGGAAGAGGYDAIPFQPLPYPVGGQGGGGNGGPTNISGTANTGGGGSGGTGDQYSSRGGGIGGSGVVIIAVPNVLGPLASISAGLTYTLDSVTRSGYRVYRFTAGTGPISW